MSKKLGKLDFEIKFRRPNEIQDIDFPVEIRRPNLSLAARGLSSGSIELEPGNYFVISKMPAGQELFDHIEIKADKKSTAHLTLEEKDESPHESEAVQHFFIADRQKVLSSFDDSEFIGNQPENKYPKVQLRSFQGNLLIRKARLKKIDWQKIEEEKGLLGFEISGAGQTPQIVQLLQSNTPPLNMMIPPMHSCRIFVTSLIDGKFTFDAHLENSLADMLLRYSNKGFDQQTKLLFQEKDAEKLLYSKFEDPIAAAVGGYALLRFNRLELLHNWTKNLYQYFVWFPDGAVIWGEHLARTGKHLEAAKVFLAIEKRGLPVFSDGLSYVIDRLTLYAEMGTDFGDENLIEKIRNLLSKLQKFALYTDFREPFTTFTGFEVNQPSNKPVENLSKDKMALNLTNLISK